MLFCYNNWLFYSAFFNHIWSLLRFILQNNAVYFQHVAYSYYCNYCFINNKKHNNKMCSEQRVTVARYNKRVQGQ